MDQQQAAEVLRNLDLRTKRMEQILPDLPTRAEMREAIDTSIRAAVAPLATREEMHEAIQAALAPLATKDELAHQRDELRRHMDVWAERIHDDVKLLADAIRMVDEKHTRNYEDLRQRLVELTRTEAQHHAAITKNFEELRGYWRDYMKAHTKEHVEIGKSIDKLRGRVEKIEAKQPRRRKAS